MLSDKKYNTARDFGRVSVADSSDSFNFLAPELIDMTDYVKCAPVTKLI